MRSIVYVLLEWFDLNSNIPVNELQGACRKGSSSINVAFNLHETVTNIQDPDSYVYLCLLDARQAFDTVWYQGLFYKLARGGCNKHLWRIMWEYYQGFQCSVLISGGATKWFVAEQGLHQGGPFSMRLYVIFNSDLLDIIEILYVWGVRISNLPYSICCPAYSDDVAIVSLHKPNLQKLTRS